MSLGEPKVSLPSKKFENGKSGTKKVKNEGQTDKKIFLSVLTISFPDSSSSCRWNAKSISFGKEQSKNDTKEKGNVWYIE